jgi:MFS transporter, DHA3 family, macrolide efflux protein
VLVLGILFGLVLGLLAGGSITNLALVRLRWVPILLFAVILRFATEYFVIRGSGLVDALRLPLFGIAFSLLLAALWVNRTHPGLRIAFVGILLNTVAIVANFGHMPIWLPSLLSAGFRPSDTTSFHVLLDPALSTDFFLHAGPLADILPIPLPLIRNVASIGDVFLTAGLAFFLFATIVRVHDADAETAGLGEAEGGGLTEPRLAGLAGTARLPRSLASAIGGQRVRPGTGLAPGLRETAALDRPLVLGTPGPGLAGPSGAAALGRAIALAPLPAGGAAAFEEGVLAPPRPRIEVGERVRQHPYVRLALNGSFSALWTGQLISLFGDRVHQLALTFLVAGVTNSPLAVALVFVAATLPNLLLSPIAGTYVDRWNQRDVLIVSDLLRAASVLLIPIVATANIYLVYPLVFLITSISIFFRPARVAVLPRIVREDELVTANSAMWAGETFADVIGYPLAGIFVAFLGTALPLAFWIDAATYVASAILIASIAIPAVKRRRTPAGGAVAAQPSVFAEMLEGFHFLRRERVLFANTIQATFAQFAIGSLTALTPIFVKDVLAPPSGVDPKAAYAFLETAIGVGNLVGGFAIGLIGARLMKGRMVIAGYVLWGATLVAFALSGNLLVDFGILFGNGVANMVFVIPSQVLFQERTPADMIGRVVGFRFALVFGSMTLAMAVGGLMAQVIGIAPVLLLSGLVTMTAGLAGLLVPEMRDA